MLFLYVLQFNLIDSWCVVALSTLAQNSRLSGWTSDFLHGPVIATMVWSCMTLNLAVFVPSKTLVLP